MNSSYQYKRPVRRSRHAVMKRYILMAGIASLVIIAAVLYILHNLRGQSSKPVSGTELTQIADPRQTFIGPYFQFQDSGKWSLDKHDSTANHFVYLKYRKNLLEHQLDIYVDTVPISLYLASPRVLPVRIVNNNSLDITNVSSPCGSLYAPGELHKIREIVINNATMLCDPDSPQYIVELAEINGDYRLNMHRPDGTPIQFVVTYKDVGLDPKPTSLQNVASSFQAR